MLDLERLIKDKTTKRIWKRDFLKQGLSQEIQRATLRELILLATFGHSLEKLKEVFGKDLRLMKGNKKGFYCLKVNDQYRIIFKWENGKPYEIEFNKHYWE
jgi:toxin HigB-1